MSEFTSVSISQGESGEAEELSALYASITGIKPTKREIFRLGLHDLRRKVGKAKTQIKNPGSAATVPGQVPSTSPRSKERMT